MAEQEGEKHHQLTRCITGSSNQRSHSNSPWSMHVLSDDIGSPSGAQLSQKHNSSTCAAAGSGGGLCSTFAPTSQSAEQRRLAHSTQAPNHSQPQVSSCSSSSSANSLPIGCICCKEPFVTPPWPFPAAAAPGAAAAGAAAVPTPAQAAVRGAVGSRSCRQQQHIRHVC
jgi:hypothetical protein